MTAWARNGRAPTAALILLAAGSGQRVGNATNKVLLPLAGRRVFTWSLDWTATVREITDTILVVRDDDRAAAIAAIARESPGRDITIVSGGSARHDSEWAGLETLAPAIRSGAIDVVVIHDAARPLAGSDLFRDVIAAARKHGGALPGRPVRGLLPRSAHVASEEVPVHASRGVRSQNGSAAHVTASNGAAPSRTDGDASVPRPDASAPSSGAAPTVVVQTPQAFRARPLLEAYEAAARQKFIGSDTAACIERFADLDIVCLPGEAHNIKITYPEDLFVAERLLARSGFSLPRRSGRSR